jgi:hypothetical protein
MLTGGLVTHDREEETAASAGQVLQTVLGPGVRVTGSEALTDEVTAASFAPAPSDRQTLSAGRPCLRVVLAGLVAGGELVLGHTGRGGARQLGDRLPVAGHLVGGQPARRERA